MSKRVSVTVTENGPLKVSGEGLSVQYCGQPLAIEPGQDVYLCRCGESQNAPFCDGRHGATGFVAEAPAATPKPLSVWEGRTIKTFFNPNACMHVFYCKPLKALRASELAGDDAAAAEIARVVQSCPSGALTFESTVVTPSALAERPAIDIIEGGEVRIQCDFEVNAELNERQSADRATMCRCGLSKNKPWCDGRHKKRQDFK